MKDGLDIVYYLILAAIIALIITHPTGFASAITSIGTEANATLGTIVQ